MEKISEGQLTIILQKIQQLEADVKSLKLTRILHVSNLQDLQDTINALIYRVDGIQLEINKLESETENK